MFSRRLPRDLTTNRLTLAEERMRRDGREVIDLTGTNPTRAGLTYPPDLLEPLADQRALTYSPAPFGLPSAREAVSRDYRRQGLDVPPERIVLTASTSEAYGFLFKLLCDAGDEVLVPRPSYPLFDHLTSLEMVAVRHYDLEYHARWTVDVESVERAFTGRTRAVLVVSPNNPTGSYITREELDELASICARRDAALIVDEVFADYALDARAAASAGRATMTRGIGEIDGALTFALGGLSKSVGLPQVKLGWMAIGGPAAAAADAMSRLELICDSYLSVGTPVQAAAAALLERGAAVRAQITERVRANLRTLESQAAAAAAVDVLRVEGGWSAVLRVPTLGSEDDLVLDLLTRDGVLTHPGYFFDFPHESFLVVSLLTPPSEFCEGVTRVLRHFDCTTSS